MRPILKKFRNDDSSAIIAMFYCILMIAPLIVHFRTVVINNTKTLKLIIKQNCTTRKVNIAIQYDIAY